MFSAVYPITDMADGPNEQFRRSSVYRWAGRSRKCGTAMCDKCVEIDGKIDHYRSMSSRVTDQTTLDGIKQLIETMKAQKTAPHAEQE
jgi:hypothetical protein